MTTRISRHVRAPIEDVFAFFDDLSYTLEFNPHAERIDVVHHKPDGRRTYDVVMRSDTNEWMQTVEQVLREPPTRLVTRGGSWTNDRRKWLLTIATDRRFSVDGDGTRIDITIEIATGPAASSAAASHPDLALARRGATGLRAPASPHREALGSAVTGVGGPGLPDEQKSSGGL